jgi:hypothetical protein
MSNISGIKLEEFDPESIAFSGKVQWNTPTGLMHSALVVNGFDCGDDHSPTENVVDTDDLGRYCSQCGNDVVNIAKFCSQCGHKIGQ